MPLSFRGNGAFTFPPKKINESEFEFATHNELIKFSKEHINKIEETHKRVKNLSDYLNYIENHTDVADK